MSRTERTFDIPFILLVLACFLAILASPSQVWPSTKVVVPPTSTFNTSDPVANGPVALDELVLQDIKDVQKECPTCTFRAEAGGLMNPTEHRQDAATIFVWYPGDEPLVIHYRKRGIPIIFIFIPTGDSNPELKKFLSHLPEGKK